MGLFDKITKIAKLADKIESNVGDIVESIMENTSFDSSGAASRANSIVLSASSHIVEDEIYGDNDSKYLISFQVNDAFKKAESHAGEVDMLNTYAPTEEYGEEGTYPYIALQLDNAVYNAVEEFRKNGSFAGAIEITALSGKFYFKAKMKYYQHIMYFYGMDRCDGFWINNGLCMVYPMKYVGTEDERKLMRVLDEAAESYREVRIE